MFATEFAQLFSSYSVRGLRHCGMKRLQPTAAFHTHSPRWTPSGVLFLTASRGCVTAAAGSRPPRESQPTTALSNSVDDVLRSYGGALQSMALSELARRLPDTTLEAMSEGLRAFIDAHPTKYEVVPDQSQGGRLVVRAVLRERVSSRRPGPAKDTFSLPPAEPIQVDKLTPTDKPVDEGRVTVSIMEPSVKLPAAPPRPISTSPTEAPGGVTDAKSSTPRAAEKNANMDSSLEIRAAPSAAGLFVAGEYVPNRIERYAPLSLSEPPPVTIPLPTLQELLRIIPPALRRPGLQRLSSTRSGELRNFLDELLSFLKQHLSAQQYVSFMIYDRNWATGSSPVTIQHSTDLVQPTAATALPSPAALDSDCILLLRLADSATVVFAQQPSPKDAATLSAQHPFENMEASTASRDDVFRVARFLSVDRPSSIRGALPGAVSVTQHDLLHVLLVDPRLVQLDSTTHAEKAAYIVDERYLPDELMLTPNERKTAIHQCSEGVRNQNQIDKNTTGSNKKKPFDKKRQRLRWGLRRLRLAERIVREGKSPYLDPNVAAFLMHDLLKASSANGGARAHALSDLQKLLAPAVMDYGLLQVPFFRVYPKLFHVEARGLEVLLSLPRATDAGTASRSDAGSQSRARTTPSSSPHPEQSASAASEEGSPTLSAPAATVQEVVSYVGNLVNRMTEARNTRFVPITIVNVRIQLRESLHDRQGAAVLAWFQADSSRTLLMLIMQHADVFMVSHDGLSVGIHAPPSKDDP